jgi:predicted Zn-dependent protease
MKEFDHDMITRYLDGELNAEELQAFEAAMQQDAELRNEVALFREVQDTLKRKLYPDEKEEAFKNTLQQLNEEYFSKEKEQAKVVPLFRRKWMMAAAAIFIMALVLTVWKPWEQDDLYTQYADIQMPSSAVRGAAADSMLVIAVDRFNNRDFKNAIPAFEAVLKDSAQNSFVQFYYGIALLQHNDITASRKQLTEIYNGNSSFKYEAAFYLALTYLKEKQEQETREWLNKIPADAGSYSKARELLKKL